MTSIRSFHRWVARGSTHFQSFHFQKVSEARSISKSPPMRQIPLHIRPNSSTKDPLSRIYTQEFILYIGSPLKIQQRHRVRRQTLLGRALMTSEAASISSISHRPSTQYQLLGKQRRTKVAMIRVSAITRLEISPTHSKNMKSSLSLKRKMTVRVTRRQDTLSKWPQERAEYAQTSLILAMAPLYRPLH